MSIYDSYCSLRLITTHPLNRDKKIKSILRFARWQIGSRLINRPVVYDWVNGSRFMVKKGEIGLTGNIYAGLHEFADMGFLLHVLRPDDLFIDVGANVGSYTILACSAVGASGYAFEPVPSTYEKLIENIHLNYLENRVKCFNIGVSKEPGTLAFTTNMDTVNHAIASGEHSDNTINVEVSTLDLILENESPSLMKIDVEGFETPVLEGASETLKKESLHSVIMELNGSGSRYGFDESLILEMMFDYGFKTYSYDPLDRTLQNLQGKNQKSGNTLFIRDEPFVMDRIKSSPKINIHGKQF
jgi:FkbM family methyltransferase